MPDIVHSSLGARPMNVAVTGVDLALPKESDLRYRMEVDSGVVASGTDLTSWTSSVGTKVFTPENYSTNKVQVDSTVQLGGFPTIKLAPLQTSLPYYHVALGGGAANIVDYSVAGNRIFPVAVVAKLNSTNGGWEYYQLVNFYSDGPYSAADLIIKPAAGKIQIWVSRNKIYDVSMPTGFNKTGWHVYVYSVDYVSEKISLYVDGVCLVDDASYTDMSWGLAGVTDRFGMRTPYQYSTGTDANVAAVIAWQPKVFDADDYADASAYLMAKYGLD